ncbi:MAG TPA: 50S ribosomal protein L19 [Candidatus Saccharibacteria bacterium]|jgi:large subunit ribosomal protein L19|nr:50S ribosomal protein L19 [Candidatus Saccharibacteria bacterium]HMT55248.1 50S ribosomal protein L19 [Candidatus Saccharibacteria bacterium]
MNSVLQDVANSYKKAAVVDVRSGDTVRVHQKIKEGNKERVQVFEGMVIRTSKKQSHTATITVRRITGGVGVEKSYLLHSPLVTKVEITKRGKVRRNYLTYMRDLRGKSARLVGREFDRIAVNNVRDEAAEQAEAEAKAAVEAEHAAKEAEKAKEQAELEAKQKAVEEAHKATEA